MNKLLVVLLRQLLYFIGIVGVLFYSDMLWPLVTMFQNILDADDVLIPQVVTLLVIASFFLPPVIKQLRKENSTDTAEQPAVDKHLSAGHSQGKDPQSRRIKSNKQPGIISMIIGGIVLIFGGSIAAAVVPEAITQGELLKLVLLAFPLAGLVLLVQGWKARSHAITGPQDSVELTPYPGQVGGLIAGHVDIPTAGRTSVDALNRDYKTVIKLMKTSTSGSGEDRRTSTAIVTEKVFNSRSEAAAQGIRVPFKFSIPKGFPESRNGSGDGYWYQLEIHSADQSYSNSFELPVLKKASQLDDELGTEASTGEPAPAVRNNMTPIEIDSGKPALGWGLVLMGVIFSAVGIGLSLFGNAPVIFPIVFTPVGGLLLVFGVLSSVTRYHTRITAQGISHTTYRMGKATRQQGWNREQLNSLHLKSGGSSTVNGRMTEYFQLVLRTNDGRDINIEFGLKGREAALQRMKQLGQQAALAISYEPLARTTTPLESALMTGTGHGKR